MNELEFRIEKDSMGEIKVPKSAYYAAQTQRALENFPISGIRFSKEMISSLGLIKRCAAIVNNNLGLLDNDKFNLIKLAALEVEQGLHDQEFVIDIFQTGSGTSSNMNANEVIANRARELATDQALKIHPNDHVNMSQSSNDVIPTAIHVACANAIFYKLLPALSHLEACLEEKVCEWSEIVKTGRTHLADATPITLGQEFSGYRSQITHSIARLKRSLVSLLELPLGGTAVGTGVNTHPKFSKSVISEIARATKLDFFEAENHFEAQAAKDGLVEVSGQLKTVACSLTKIANDIRWLGSGPRCGLQELFLPEVQPGSSIMPAKVNPVICESVLMVCAQVIGNDAAVTVGGHSGGVFELNVMMPVMAHNILQSIQILASSSENFANQCIIGLKPNLPRIKELAEINLSVVTALAPILGYDKSADIAKEAFKNGTSLREVVLNNNLMNKDDLDKALDLLSMTKPGL